MMAEGTPSSSSQCRGVMDQNLAKQLREAERDIAQTERTLGKDHPELADKLTRYAGMLREAGRSLDAVNVEARGRAIRARIYAAEAEAQQTGPMPTQVMPKQQSGSPWMYAGFIAVFASMGSLFVDQNFFKFIAPVALLFAVTDLVLSRSWWRALLTVLFLGCAGFSMQSLPDFMMVNSSPLERYNFASQNPELVSKVKALGRPKRIWTYEMGLSDKFMQEEVGEKEDWGRALTFHAEAHPDQTSPRLLMLSLKVPSEILKNFRTYPLLKLATDVALPQIRGLTGIEDLTVETPSFEDVNGFQFVRMPFTGHFGDNVQMAKGVAYVAKDKRSLVVVTAFDTAGYADELIDEIDTSMYTFRRQGKADAER